ncbi:hypothetical protein P43SY_011663 [Pythium insidiosum]|uniref:No apical meristem-associated C-terminal domain-containing protein n=1 Tax=Pythium insidiosum TaxID=114742 RepID=A0AAD5LR99_PYTIN|nr:hypothetical protein P43SY_011663 [Pythium insidiosum]
MKVFQDIAFHCAKDKSFSVQKSGTDLRTRYNVLLQQYRVDQCKSMRQSGTSEEYEEREVLLQGVVAQVDDWRDQQEQEKQQKSAKERALVKSVEVLKHLAMGEPEDEDESEDTDESTTTTGTPRVGKKRFKATKADRFGVMADAKSRKSENQMKKLKFDREQAELQRKHERDESARRREYELALENRRIQAEKERECMLHEFLLKVLSR